MKKLFLTLVLILSLILFSSESANAISGLESTRVYSMAGQCTDDTYIYGVRNGQASSKLFRMLESGSYIQPNGEAGDTPLFDFATIGNSPNGSAYDAVQWSYKTHTLKDGANYILLAMVSDAGGYRYIFKSVDGGISFGSNAAVYNDNNPVHNIGTDGGGPGVGGQITGVNMLPRNMAEDTHNEQLIFNNYGPNDGYAAVVKSTNAGTTWSRVVFWNTGAGGTPIRHIHSVVYDPYSCHTYICVGDSNAESGIIPWDGTSVLTDNLAVTAANYTNAMGEHEKYRVVDILFRENNMYYASDSATVAAAQGIWKIPRISATSLPDWANMERVDNAIADTDAHAGAYGVIVGDSMFFTEFAETTSADAKLNIYSSTDGETWSIVGKVGALDTASVRSPNYGFFLWEDHIYFSASNLAGVLMGSVKLMRTNDVDTDRILHPVYYVSSTGNNANDGYSEAEAWASPEYALEGNHIRFGSRVRIAEGEYDVSNIILAWSGASNPSTGTVVIEGAGRDKTFIFDTAGNLYYLFYVQSAEGPICVKNLAGYLSSSREFPIVFQLKDNTTFTLENCTLGSESYTCHSLTTGANVTCAIKNTLFNNSENNTHENITHAYGSDLSLTSCISKGGRYGLKITHAGTTTTVKNCVFSGYQQQGITYVGVVDNVPTVKNCIFSSAGIPAITDSAGLTETDADIDYNCYADNESLASLANNGGTHSMLNTNPKFYSDFQLRRSSPCIDEGTDVSVTHDFLGYRVPNNSTPDIGAYEYYRKAYGSMHQSVCKKTSGAILKVEESGLVNLDSSNGNMAVYLPPLNLSWGVPFFLHRDNDGTNTITIYANEDGETLNGATSKTLVTQHDTLLVWGGTDQWYCQPYTQ